MASQADDQSGNNDFPVWERQPRRANEYITTPETAVVTG